MFRIFSAGYISAEKQVLMKNYNLVSEFYRVYSEETEHEMTVSLRSASVNIFNTLSVKNCNISKNACQ